MNKIDTTSWQLFNIGNLFEIRKGTRLVKADMKEGDYPFIGASAAHNGITAMISNDEHLHPKNTITISYNGSVGEAFYQDNAFWASDDVNVLYPKFEMNKYVAMYIIPILKKVGQKYAFIDKWKKEDMEKDQIRLPVDATGNPDFSYMESYMKNLEIAVSASLTKLQSAKQLANSKHIDNVVWKEFFIKDLFPKIIKPEVYHTREVEQYDAGIPYVVRSKFNNGIKYRVVRRKRKVNPPNVISFGAENATFFYQKEEWISGRDMYYIDTQDLDEYACLYLTACLQPIATKYSYNFGLFPDLLKKEKVKLPVDEFGKPDYAYMTNYMAMLKSKTERNMRLLNIAQSR